MENENKENSEYTLGIDLGTTYSCIAYWDVGKNKAEVIPTLNGNRILPSIVSFTKKEIMCGDEAKNQLTKNQKNTIYEIKRLIGRNFSDPIVQEDIKHWPFTVIKDEKTDEPRIKVKYKNEDKLYRPEEISSMVLMKLKIQAQQYFNKEIKKAIITCPAYFNQNQRKSTSLAGEIAGLEVIRIIDEPTAAAIAYGIKEKSDKERNILVFDLGGGTFDVSILYFGDETLEVRSSRGDTHLGGVDFDNRIMDYCIKKFKENTNIDISNQTKALRRLRDHCEKAKIILSSSLETSIEVESITEDNDLNVFIERADFEFMCDDLFKKCFPCIEEAIKDAKLEKENINDIILIGGSSRIPKIQEMLKNYFQGKELYKNLPMDEAVAIGAAIQSAMSEDVQDDSIEKLILIDITPLSLGVKLSNGEMDVIIPRNSSIPVTKDKNYQVGKSNMKELTIKVYQGERKLAEENMLLGEFKIKLPQNRDTKGIKINVKFYLNLNGILKVSAQELTTNTKIECDVIVDKKIPPKEIIEKLIEEGKQREKDDLENIAVIEFRNHLQNIALDMKKNGKNEDSKKKGNEVNIWINKHKDENMETYKKKYDELMEFK